MPDLTQRALPRNIFSPPITTSVASHDAADVGAPEDVLGFLDQGSETKSIHGSNYIAKAVAGVKVSRDRGELGVPSLPGTQQNLRIPLLGLNSVEYIWKDPVAAVSDARGLGSVPRPVSNTKWLDCRGLTSAFEKKLDKQTIGVYTPIMKAGSSQSEWARSKAAENVAECVCGNLRMAARAITQLYDEELRPTGLRLTQFSILGATKAMEPVTVTQLAEATVTDRTTLTRNLKLLQKRGLIRVQVGNDRREREVTLTDRGTEALIRGLPLWHNAQARVVKGLSERRWKGLRGELSAVVSLTRES